MVWLIQQDDIINSIILKLLGYYLRGCSDHNDDGKRFPYID